VLDQTQLVYDVSGAGNNWAHGHHGYGPRYRAALLEQLRRAAEDCDSLQSFLLLHSLGGGTGSGLGTYILGMLQVRMMVVGGGGGSGGGGFGWRGAGALVLMGWKERRPALLTLAVVVSRPCH